MFITKGIIDITHDGIVNRYELQGASTTVENIGTSQEIPLGNGMCITHNCIVAEQFSDGSIIVYTYKVKNNGFTLNQTILDTACKDEWKLIEKDTICNN